MTIQISVVIWTIINFVLLYLVLNFLLFKPMLKFMDERNAKIEQGKTAVAEKQAKLKAKAEEKAAFIAAKDRLLKEKVESGVAAAKEECRKDRIDGEKQQAECAAKKNAALKEDEAALKETLAKALPALSDKVVQSLLEKGL